jgi:hypothetical protein
LKHPPRRQRQADGAESRAHPLASLARGLVGQADQQQCRRPARDLHLPLTGTVSMPEKGERAHAGDRGGGEQCGQNLAA